MGRKTTNDPNDKVKDRIVESEHFVRKKVHSQSRPQWKDKVKSDW